MSREKSPSVTIVSGRARTFQDAENDREDDRGEEAVDLQQRPARVERDAEDRRTCDEHPDDEPEHTGTPCVL
jgi:hypothetical protein